MLFAQTLAHCVLCGDVGHVLGSAPRADQDPHNAPAVAATVPMQVINPKNIIIRMPLK